MYVYNVPVKKHMTTESLKKDISFNCPLSSNRCSLKNVSFGARNLVKGLPRLSCSAVKKRENASIDLNSSPNSNFGPRPDYCKHVIANPNYDVNLRHQEWAEPF